MAGPSRLCKCGHTPNEHFYLTGHCVHLSADDQGDCECPRYRYDPDVDAGTKEPS